MAKEKPKPSPAGTPVSSYQISDERPSPIGTPISHYDTPPRAQQLKPRKVVTARTPKNARKPMPKVQVARKPKKGETWILTVLDTYGWAYDVGCRGLYNELRKQHPDWILDKCLYKDVENGLIETGNYDVVFVWAWWNFTNQRFYPWLKLLEKLNPEKSILCVAGEYHLPYIRNGLEQIRRFKFRYMAGNNEKIVNTLRKLGKYDAVFTLEFGVDFSMFKPTPFPKKFTVGWVGHQGRRVKRYEMAVAACKQARVPLKVAGHVYGKKYIPHKQMPHFYKGVSIILITSESEAHPLIYYEALACGRPVVSTLVGDIPTTARNGKNGFYLPVKCTVNQIAKRIRILKEDPKRLMTMGAQGRNDVTRLWDWKKISVNYINAISHIRLGG